MRLLLVNDEGQHLGELELEGNTATLKKLKPEMEASVIEAYDEDDHDDEKDEHEEEEEHEGIEPDDMEKSMSKGGELNDVFKGKKSPSDVRKEKDELEGDEDDDGYTPSKNSGPMKQKRPGLF